MKQQILNALRTKFDGVSDAILDRVANKLAQTVTTAEQVQTAVDGVSFQQVLESYGDSRANQAQQTAVRNYEEKYGLKDGKSVNTGNDEGRHSIDGICHIVKLYSPMKQPALGCKGAQPLF